MAKDTEELFIVSKFRSSPANIIPATHQFHQLKSWKIAHHHFNPYSIFEHIEWINVLFSFMKMNTNDFCCERFAFFIPNKIISGFSWFQRKISKEWERILKLAHNFNHRNHQNFQGPNIIFLQTKIKEKIVDAPIIINWTFLAQKYRHFLGIVWL